MTLVLVTGASSGLGYGAAKELADSGHDVVIHLRTPARQAGAHDRRWAGVISGDLSQLDEVRSVAAQAASFGRFDGVIHNAGTMHLPVPGMKPRATVRSNSPNGSRPSPSAPACPAGMK